MKQKIAQFEHDMKKVQNTLSRTVEIRSMMSSTFADTSVDSELTCF